MKKVMIMLLAVAMATGMLTGCKNSTSDTNNEMKKIGVIQISDHPSLNTIRDSMTKQLEELGYIDGQNCKIEYQSAGGEPTTANSIVQSFAGSKQDIIVAIATPTAQAAATVSDKIPVIFSAVSDPISAGLVKSLEKPDGNITGTSDEIQVGLILELALKCNPNMKKLGFIYNTSEANSVSNLEKAKAFCNDKGIKVIEGAVTNTSEVQQVAQVLASKVDAIFAPNDNTVASAMQVLADAARKAKIPLYCGADSMVNDGGFATIGINYEDLGRETANMVDAVLKGKSPSDIPVKVFKDNLKTIFNEETAKAIGYEKFVK